jgi:hypothetical protein
MLLDLDCAQQADCESSPGVSREDHFSLPIFALARHQLAQIISQKSPASASAGLD